MNGALDVAAVPSAVRDWRTPLLLLLVGAVFGSSFLFMRIAAPEMGPQALVGVRLACGAARWCCCRSSGARASSCRCGAGR
jgi:hypothetical protein